jgi:hypothetical protein
MFGGPWKPDFTQDGCGQGLMLTGFDPAFMWFADKVTCKWPDIEKPNVYPVAALLSIVLKDV